MIPKQLKNLRFCRIIKGTKKPFEKEWTIKPYYYDDISKFFPGENYGIICGYNNLAVIDCDEESIKLLVEEMLPKTFSVKTGRGGMHFYYFIPELVRKVILELEGKHLGEIQSFGSQVVGAGSIHPNGKEYEIINNVGIKEISLEELNSVLKEYMKQVKESPKGDLVDPLANEFKEKIKITEIAKKYGLKVEKNMCLCPFHDDGDPSLGFSDSLGVFHCFGCGAKGNIIKFMQMLEDVKNK